MARHRWMTWLPPGPCPRTRDAHPLSPETLKQTPGNSCGSNSCRAGDSADWVSGARGDHRRNGLGARRPVTPAASHCHVPGLRGQNRPRSLLPVTLPPSSHTHRQLLEREGLLVTGAWPGGARASTCHRSTEMDKATCPNHPVRQPTIRHPVSRPVLWSLSQELEVTSNAPELDVIKWFQDGPKELKHHFLLQC